MAKKLVPAGEFVLVLDASRDTVISGIEMPSNVRQQEMVFGTIAVVGEDATKRKAGEVICYGPYAGKNVVLEGVEFRLLHVKQIEGVVREE